MPYISITPKPGIKKNGTDYANKNSWIDGNLVRFENGFLANTAKEWYEGLRKLIADKELRRKVGRSAFKTVEEGWQMNDNIKLYADLFKEVLDKPAR